MKKILIMFIFAAAFISNAAIASASFSDVSNLNPFYNAINYVQSEDIVSGYPDGTYKPDNLINRAEFVKILVGAALDYNSSQDPSGYDIYALVGIDLTDIPHGEWYVPYVRKALANDIIEGYPDMTFRALNNINKAEAAKIIVKSFNIETLDESVNVNWFDNYIYALEQKRFVPTSLVCSDQNVTRGELAEMIYRVKTYITTKDSPTTLGLTDTGKIKFLSSPATYNKCDSNGFMLPENETATPVAMEPKTVTLDDSDVLNGSTMYDFDTEQRTNMDVTPDMSLSGMFYEDEWMRGVNWMVVPMEGTFDDITECPADGYANVYDDDGDGFGTPYNAWQGDVYCLQTSDNNYVLLEVTSSYNEGDNRYLIFKYLMNKTGGTKIR